MTETSDNSSDNQYQEYDLRDNALAHILMSANTPKQSQLEEFGRKASIQELRSLAIGGLSTERREQILRQLSADPDLYKVWMAMPSPTKIENRKTGLPKDQTWIKKLTGLFEWHTLAPLAMGIALGVLIPSDLLKIEQDGHIGRNMVEAETSAEAPIKANSQRFSNLTIEQYHTCTSWVSGNRKLTLCASDSQAVQNWSIITDEGTIHALSVPVSAQHIRDIKINNNRVFVLAELEEKYELNVLNIPSNGAPPSKIDSLVIQTLEGSTSNPAKILSVDDTSFYYRVGMETFEISLSKIGTSSNKF